MQVWVNVSAVHPIRSSEVQNFLLTLTAMRPWLRAPQSSRYEHSSLILTSNLPFSRWGDVFSDQVVAAAMIDHIVHHADVLTLKGNSYRLRNTEIDTLPSHRNDGTAD